MTAQYSKLHEQLAKGNVEWDGASVVRCLLLRDTGSYVFDPDHAFVADVFSNGGVEISVASYGRQTVPTRVVAIDAATNRTALQAGEIDFGVLEAGQTVEAIVYYLQTGGDDLTPADDPLLFYQSATSPVILAADVALSGTQLWVHPLVAPIPDGTSITFDTSGGVGVLSGAAAVGDRQLTLTGGGISQATSAGDRSDVANGTILPAALADGTFKIIPDVARGLTGLTPFYE